MTTKRSTKELIPRKVYTPRKIKENPMIHLGLYLGAAQDQKTTKDRAKEIPMVVLKWSTNLKQTKERWT